MRKKTASRSRPHERYWEARIRAPEFTRALADVVALELKTLARERIRDVVDPEFVRTMIRDLDARLVDRARVADLVVEVTRRMGARLSGREQSLLDLLDRRLIADMETILATALELSPRARDFVATLMRQEFVRGLLTDVIYTAIVSFHQRLNPLFGALATRALENQIKGFIRLFMPMLHAQAVAFAIDPRNQRIVLEFVRAVGRQLLEVPLARYAALASSGNDKRAEAVLRKTVKNATLSALARQAALAVWDDLYTAIRNKRVGDLLRLEEHADWLAGRCLEMLLPVLSRPHVLRFIAAETALAAAR